MTLSSRLLIKPGTLLSLPDIDPDETHGFAKGPDLDAALERNLTRLDELQYLMYAEHRRALLVVLQGMDAAGKDGTIRHVIKGFNPQGCRVTAFKTPTPEEAAHDFLWRVHPAVPRRGDVAIFNRSYYEDVVVVRVHKLVPEHEWKERYEEINAFERLLADHGTVIVKLFLHISKDEQKRRLERRLDDKTRQWKVSLSDFEDRKSWKDYMRAYEDAISKCNGSHAPWYVVPANHKWFRNLAVSQILVDTLEALDMKFPKPSVDLSAIRLD
ncbi:MAG TPA: polyphosphate kinase 2 family protein [Gemmatimonadales bacterium]|nr:polyphosphate kinase 2 family protein [Gemmatimonadales bacterium]